MGKPKKIGDLLDSLGLMAEVEDGDMPTDALVILKVVKPDGEVALIKGKSESVDWITSLGMLNAAVDIETGGYERVGDDDDPGD